MQTKVVKLSAVEPDLVRIREAAALVEAGALVAFPTETVYGIAARVKRDSLARLSKVKGREPEKAYSLHIGKKDDVKKYVPAVGVRAGKLIGRVWPGPLTIVFELDSGEVENRRGELEREVFEGLYRDNCIGIRCPDNLIASMLLMEARCAVVAPSANPAGEPPAVNGEEVLAQFSGRVELLLDGGPCKYKESSTVVKVGKKGLEVLRAGVYSEADLEAISQVRFLFVCTGNTCRSAMAEGLFRKYLAEKLGCRVDQLEKAGYNTGSAGVVAADGFPASAGAVAACAAKGVDIRAHTSRALSEELVQESDLIFAMCEMHRERVADLSREAANRCLLLAEGTDIPDPVGQPQDVYNSCAQLIEEAVRRRIGELVI
ncbi:MAG: L-threonylcarbamoyladenylate synthase [Planctomycetota bacterium]|jgi:tRNA threonylcarbamoyl adenosine modification protein (Sua5/YciO/YrdC/YwlC family)